MLLTVSLSGQTASVVGTPEIVVIEFSGNLNLSSSDLLDQISINEKRLFTTGSYYNRHHLTREMQRLQNYYTLNGFLDAVVQDSVVQYSEDEAGIFIQVTEGKQYYLRDVTLKGNTVFSDEQYLELIEDQAGLAFNTFRIREKLIDMLNLYRNNGYPLIFISDSVAVEDSVSLFINVNEGPKLRVSTINVTAPPGVPEDIIRREVIVASGDWFNLENIQESKRRLFETSLFNSVNIRMGKLNADSTAIALDVEVLPAKFRGVDMNFGVKQGYIYNEGDRDPEVSIGLSGRWYHNNLFERSKRTRIQTELSSIYPSIFIPQKFELNFFYVEPWLGTNRTPFTINPFYWYIDDARNDFQNIAYGIRTITTYRWFRRIKVRALAEWSSSSSSGTPTEDDQEYKEARKVGVKFTWDERDNYFYPQKGFKFVVEPEMVGYILGGENNYLQFKTSFSSYWSLFSRWVFAHNVDLAIAKQKDPDIPIPYEHTFFLGGNSSIRGYEQQGVGATTESNGKIIPAGGNFRFYTNFELRFPIYKILGGEVFLDVGNLWDNVEDADISDLKKAAGFGVTIETPIGPARIDYGIPLEGGLAISSGQAHIAIAYAF